MKQTVIPTLDFDSELTTTSSPGDATSVAINPETDPRGITGSPGSDHTTYNQESTSIPAMATEDSVASTLQETTGILPYAVGGAVGGLVVIIVILLMMIIVSLFVREHRKKSQKVESNNNIGLPTFNNALYGVGKETGSVMKCPNWYLHCAIYSLAHSDLSHDNCMVTISYYSS